MKCLNCGTENPEEMKFCGNCGRTLPQPLPVQPMQPMPKRETHTALIIAVVVVAVVVIVAVIALILITAPKADLRADLLYSAENDWLGSGGTIEVYGMIYNYGDKMGGGTVYLHVYDGYAWHDYEVPTGVVPANGSEYFYWDGYFDPMDDSSCEVEYSIETG